MTKGGAGCVVHGRGRFETCPYVYVRLSAPCGWGAGVIRGSAEDVEVDNLQDLFPGD